MFKPPKSIANHPAVASVVAGEGEGSDYKYWVFLKEGEEFTGDIWRGCSGGAGFDTVAEFRIAMGND